MQRREITPELLRPSEAAAVLGISMTTLRAWRLAGKLPAVTHGPRLVRYRRADLDRIINGDTDGGAA